MRTFAGVTLGWAGGDGQWESTACRCSASKAMRDIYLLTVRAVRAVGRLENCCNSIWTTEKGTTRKIDLAHQLSQIMITTHFHQYRRGVHDTHQIAFSLVCHWGKQRADICQWCGRGKVKFSRRHASHVTSMLKIDMRSTMWVAGMTITANSQRQQQREQQHQHHY